MIDDAINSLRTLFATSLLVLVLWFLYWPASIEKLKLYSAAVELHSWLYLRERLSTLERDVFEVQPNEIITDDIKWVQRIAPNQEHYPKPYPLMVDVIWPEQRSYAISLVPAGFDQRKLTPDARIYRIVGDRTPFPWSDYYALFLRENEIVVEGQEVIDREKKTGGVVAMDYHDFRALEPGIRQVQAALRDGNRPKRWDELRLLLAKYGFVSEPEILSSRDAALAGVRAEVDPRVPSGGVQILGVQLSIAQFFFAVGILLAITSFAMIGPLLAMRSSSVRKHSQSWILVLPRSPGKARRMLEWMVCAVSILWAVSPMLILLLQVSSYAGVDGMASWAFGLGTVGLAVSSTTYGFVARELRVTRLTG
jgi:hypothetical protein